MSDGEEEKLCLPGMPSGESRKKEERGQPRQADTQGREGLGRMARKYVRKKQNKPAYSLRMKRKKYAAREMPKKERDE